MKRLIVSLTLAALAATGCSSGGSSSEPVAAAAPSASPTHGTTTAVEIVIAPPPRTSAAARAKRPKYVSPSTLGGAFYVWAAGSSQPPTPTAVADLSATSPNCTANGDGSRTCTVSVIAPGGNDTIKANLYDAKPTGTPAAIPGTAKELSTGSAQATITANQLNTVPITLNGIVATATISFAPSYLSKGVSGSSVGTVTAEDADGNVITGSYATSISLVNADTSGATQYSPAVIPDSSTTTTFTYNGSSAFSTPTDSVSLDLGPTAVGTGSIAIVAPSKIGLNPTSVSFLGVISNLSSTVTVSEANYTGSFTASTTNCSGIANLTSNATSTTSFTFTPAGVGACTYSITDGVAVATLPINVTLSKITANVSQLTFLSLNPSDTQTVTLSEANYTGSFSYNAGGSSCYENPSNLGTLSYPTQAGAQNQTYTFTASTVGQCSVVFNDGNTPAQSLTLNVSITNTTIGGQ